MHPEIQSDIGATQRRKEVVIQKLQCEVRSIEGNDRDGGRVGGN